MMNWESLFDLMLTGLCPIAWVKCVSIDRGLNFFFFSLSIVHIKCVG